MFSDKINIFKACKEFIESECDSNRLRQDENNLKSFTTYLIKNENNNYSISDNQFSIKCIFQEDVLKNFLSANQLIQYENLSSKNSN